MCPTSKRFSVLSRVTWLVWSPDKDLSLLVFVLFMVCMCIKFVRRFIHTHTHTHTHTHNNIRMLWGEELHGRRTDVEGNFSKNL